jgi:hypothetical protein
MIKEHSTNSQYDIFIKDCRILRPAEDGYVLSPGSIGIRDGRLAWVSDEDPKSEIKAHHIIDGRGFVAMPGGYGTLEEIIEVITWGQLGFHDKPCGMLNINGYFDHLLAFLDHSEAEGFLRTQHRSMLLVANTPLELLKQFSNYAPPSVEKWRADSN